MGYKSSIESLKRRLNDPPWILDVLFQIDCGSPALLMFVDSEFLTQDLLCLIPNQWENFKVYVRAEKRC